MSSLNEGTPFPDRGLAQPAHGPGALPGLCQEDPQGSATSWKADNGHSFVVELYFTVQVSHQACITLSRRSSIPCT